MHVPDIFAETFYSGAGGEIDECQLLLRFFGDDLDPRVVTDTLGVEPTFACRLGDSTPRNTRAHTGMWLHDAPRSDKSIEQEIRSLLGGQITDDLARWKRLTDQFVTELKIHAYLHRWCRGTALSSETLRLLSDRGIAIVFDIYSQRPPVTESGRRRHC